MISTICEILGAIAITVGVGMITNFGVSLIVGGIFLITGSILASRGASE